MGMTWEQTRALIYDNAKKMEIPVRASFELTARCNFHCRMCYVCRYANDREALKQELTTEQWIKLGEEAKDAGVFFVTLTGGEVFIRRDFKQLYEAFINMGFHITINTNGSMITNEVAGWLSKYPPVKVSITLYGASPETYQKITGQSDGFARTISGIKALTAHGIYTEIKTTLIKANYNEFEEMIKLAEDLGVDFGIVSNIEQKREDVSTDPLANRLDPMEAVIYEKKFHDYRYHKYLNRVGARTKTYDDNTNGIESSDFDKTSDTSDSNAFWCSAGKYACWFNWDGKLTACGLLPIPALDVFSKPLKELWNELKDKCNEIPKCSECEGCEKIEFCNACPARFYLENGRFDKKSEYICEMAKCRMDLFPKK